MSTSALDELLDQILLSSECLERETATGGHVAVELSNLSRELEKIAPPVANVEQALLQGQLLFAQHGIDADNVDKRIHRLGEQSKARAKKKSAQVEKTPSGADNDKKKVQSVVDVIHARWLDGMTQKMEELCKERTSSSPEQHDYWKNTVIREYLIEEAKDIYRRFKESFIVDQEKMYWRQFCDRYKRNNVLFSQLDEMVQDFLCMRICLSPFLGDGAEKDGTEKDHLKLMLRGIAKCFRFLLLVEQCGINDWDRLYDLVLGQPDDTSDERTFREFQTVLERTQRAGKVSWDDWTKIRCFPDMDWKNLYSSDHMEFWDAYLQEDADLSFMYGDSRLNFLWDYCVIIVKRQMEGWRLDNQVGTSEIDTQNCLKKFYEQIRKGFNSDEARIKSELDNIEDEDEEKWPMRELYSWKALMCLSVLNFREFANVIKIDFLSGILLERKSTPGKEEYTLTLKESEVKLILEIVLLIYMRVHPMLANDECCPFTDLGDLGADISKDSGGLVQSMPEVVVNYVMTAWKRGSMEDPAELLGTVISQMDGPVTILKHMALAGYYDFDLDQFGFTTKMLPGMSLQEKVDILETLLEMKRKAADTSESESVAINELMLSVVSVCDQLPQVDKARVLRILGDHRWNTNVKPEVKIWKVAAEILFTFDRNMDMAMQLYEESRCEASRGDAKVHIIPHDELEIKELMDVLRPSIIDGSTVLSGVAIRCIAALLKRPNETQRIRVLIKFLEQLRGRGARFTTCYLSVDDQERLAWIQRMAADKK